jgi:lysophospholipase L1-like esterase
MRYDAEGFRVPAHQGAEPRRRPLVLALGCSFTYGDGCRAEDVYPQLVAAELGGTALNAGKCAYGLSQMLLLARRLIPQHRPDYVLVQFSTWLPGRGTSGFARATFGRVPVPYLLLRDDGTAGVHPPVFATRVFDLPFHEFDNKRRGAGEFARFFLTAAAPLFVHDDLAMAAYAARRALGRLPDAEQERAQRNREELNRVVYAEIGRIAEDDGARLVIVRLSHPLERHWQRLKELSPGALVVNAQAALDAHVPSGSRDEYDRLFGHWRGSPARLVDNHPNPAAHRVVAAEVARAIRAAGSGTPAATR